MFFGKLTIFVAGRVVYDSKALLILPDKPFIFTSMNYSFLDFLGLLGAVGLFLYGMKVMSEGLQKAAGDRLRNILSAMTRNRFTGTLTGFAITALDRKSVV